MTERVYYSSWEHCTKCGLKKFECSGANPCRSCAKFIRNDDQYGADERTAMLPSAETR